MKYGKLILIGLISTLAACTSVQVVPLDPELSISHVCIKNNKKVTVPDFLTVLQAGFNRHNLATTVYDDIPDDCQAILSYTALRSWDVVTYLSVAELWLTNANQQQIAHAKYHLIGKGGLSLMKWASVESKMDPVIDQLLADY